MPHDIALQMDTSEDRLRLVDVGGMGGLQAKWLPHADRIFPILFEPSPAEASKLREQVRENGLVLETALSNEIGTRKLNVTYASGCTSLRSPNVEFLSNYRLAFGFDVLSKVDVSCTRYDALFNAGLVPAPDAIKIDVQGFEYEVLQGFGGLLQSCLGIELEAHLYPIYQGQKLLHDLVAFLSDFGFVLRGMTPVAHFDGDVVEVDAWFTKNISVWRGLGEDEKRKFSLRCQAWDLIDYSRVDPKAFFTEFAPPLS
jgi:FkbM family methyltransferase